MTLHNFLDPLYNLISKLTIPHLTKIYWTKNIFALRKNNLFLLKTKNLSLAIPSIVKHLFELYLSSSHLLSYFRTTLPFQDRCFAFFAEKTMLYDNKIANVSSFSSVEKKTMLYLVPA